MRHQSSAAAFVLLMRGSGEEREILLNLRRNTGFRDGEYDVSASGHLEPSESFEQCVIRETLEEIGVALKPDDLKFCFLMHDFRHSYIYVFFMAELPEDATPRVCEPEKSGGLLWAKMNDLPKNIEPFHRKVLECIARGIYYDDGDFTKLASSNLTSGGGRL